MAENKTPKIRFKGFTEDWVQRELGEMMNVTSVKRIHQSDWTDSGVRFLRARDIVSASKNEEPSDYLYISQEKYDEYSSISGKVSSGDMLVTGVGTIGIPLLIKDSKPVYFKDGNIIWFQNNTKIEGEFFLYSFIGKSIQRFIKDSAGIGTVGTYTIDSGKKTPILLSEKAEQIQIGTFFKQLDNLITLHQRKYDKLVNVKKAMLEKMFPKNGEDVPEIRFKGFTDSWENSKAEEVFKSYADKNHPELPVLSATQEFGMVKRDDTGINVFHEKKNEMTYKRVLPGQFVIHLRSFQGGFAHSDIQGITSPAYTVFGFKKENKHFDRFWKYIFNSEEFIKRLETVTYGIRDGRSISFNEFLTMSFYYPTFEEQKKIAEFLIQHDNFINLHQQELTKLQNIKKSCLEKMFI